VENVIRRRSDEWKISAKCREYDPEWWFEDASPEENSRAIWICLNECPVKDTCLEYAVTHMIEHGIWGGLRAHARRKWKEFSGFVPTEERRPIIIDTRKL
jgi:WhiB family redox-sensing transcriptional regulator